MFPGPYFPANFWPANYWPKTGSSTPAQPVPEKTYTLRRGNVYQLRRGNVYTIATR